MKRRSFFAASVAISLVFGLAHAKPSTRGASQKQSEPTWANEPEGFLGVPFKQTFPASIPQCAKDRFGYPDFASMRKEDGMCIDGNRTTYGRLWNTPQLGFPYTVDVILEAGIPTTFILESRVENWEQLRSALVSRYGPPASRKANEVQNNAGATFDNETLDWQGKAVGITAYKRNDRVDKSQVFIRDSAAAQAKVDALKKQATEGAAKL